MLNFLRKYQKIVFGTVTAALIVSIAFFGSYGAMSQSGVQEKDVVLGKAIDGSKLSKQRLDKMKRFLVSDQFDTDLYAVNSRPNIFNNGVIRRDLIESGLASMIAEAYFDNIEKDLQERLEKQKTFKGYQHPAAPFLSSENLYAQFVPTLRDQLLKIRSPQFTLSKQSLPELFTLYQEATHFPTEYVRRFLSYQQNQYEWLAKDPYLNSGDLSLFHFHQAEDWFGPAFVEAATQVVHNGALLAKQQGMKVTFEEAKNDLIKNGYEALKAYYQDKVTAEHLDQAWKGVLAQMHLTEKEAISLWQEVLLFRKLMEDKAGSILIDGFSEEQFHKFASEAREIKRYTMSQDWAVKDFSSLVQLQTYLDAVAVKSKDKKILELPSTLKPAQEIVKTYPELAEKIYEVEYACVNLEDLTSKLSLKEIWQWEQQEDNFSRLASKFKELHAKAEDKQSALDALDDHVRFQVDKWSAIEILKSKQELTAAQLEAATLEKATWKVSCAEAKLSLAGITRADELLDLLEKSIDGEQIQQQLASYSQDGQHIYKVRLLSHPTAPRVLTFKEAQSSKALDKLADKKLKQEQKAYEATHLSEYLKEDGSAKPFEAIRLDIAAHVYKPLIIELEKLVGKETLKDLTPKERLDYLARCRFLQFMQQAQQDIATHKEESKYLNHENLFYVESTTHTLKRKDKKTWFKEEMFTTEKGQFATACLDPSLEVSFYQVASTHVEDHEQILEKMQDKQQALAKEAKKQLMTQLLDLFKEKEIVVFSDLKPDTEL